MQSGDKTIERVYNYLCDYISKKIFVQASASNQLPQFILTLSSSTAWAGSNTDQDSEEPSLSSRIPTVQNRISPIPQASLSLMITATFLLSVRSLPEFQSLLMRITLIHSLSGSPLSEILKHSCLKSAVTV